MKIKPEEITSLRSNMFTKESWITPRTKKKDLKCSNCGSLHADDDCGITLAMVTKKPNAHFCKACTEYYITNGVEDMAVKIKATEDKKEVFQKGIMELSSRYNMGNSNSRWGSSMDLTQKDISELKGIYSRLLEEKETKKRIEKEIQKNFVDTPTEEYLSEDYIFYENKDYLKHPEQIEKHFEEDYHDYFECGQGFYQDDANIICKIGDKFYSVTIYAEIWSSKQDHGDRLYWVESIKKITYEEIEKPLPKPKPITSEHMLNYLLDNYFHSIASIIEIAATPDNFIVSKEECIKQLKELIEKERKA